MAQYCISWDIPWGSEMRILGSLSEMKISGILFEIRTSDILSVKTSFNSSVIDGYCAEILKISIGDALFWSFNHF